MVPPLWLRFARGQPGARVFAMMFALESAARALLSTVITLQALSLLEDARNVSLLFSLVGVTGLLASFTIPGLVRRLTRRTVYTLGGALLVAAALALATISLPGQVLGMLMRVYGTACLSIVTSLYILQHIKKRDLTISEPMRLQFSALAWTVGPLAGVKLYSALGPAWAYGASGCLALLLLGFFWLLRLTDSPSVPRATAPPPRTLPSIRRFLAQPRLRLAWIIVFGRSCWWVFFFIYTPVYMIEAGLGGEVGAAVISAGNALLFLTPAFGALGGRFGIRRVLMAAFVVTGTATLLAGFFYPYPWVVVACLMSGALGCVALDALGNIPYLRAVHAHERPQMTTVFRTYIDFSELLTPMLFAAVLTFEDLRTVFILFGATLIAFAAWPRFLSKRL